MVQQVDPHNPLKGITSENGGRLTITTNEDIRSTLQAAGYYVQTINHPEGAWQLKQNGDDIVLHFVGLHGPVDQYTQTHFDGGGGGASVRHGLETIFGFGPSQDEVTRYLGRREATAQYLRGISDSMDKLLTQK